MLMQMAEVVAQRGTCSRLQVGAIFAKDGRVIDWRADLAAKLLNLQREDGSWANGTGRWMESDRVLATSYMLLALARIHGSL